MKNNPLISLIIPAHNEQDNLEWHHKIISDYMRSQKIDYEIIYIDDGSTDNTRSILQNLAKSYSQVHYLSFSRNFGKEAATTAGIRHAKGDAAIIMDADGQHPIELVETFINEWQGGYSTVIGIRTVSKHANIIKSLGSRLFYIFMRMLGSNESTQAGLTDFRIIDRRIIDEFNHLSEHNRVTRNLLDWLGFRRKLVPFEANERHAGTATYSVRKLIKLAIDGLVKHSTRPLKFIGLFGALVSVLSFFILSFSVIEMYFLHDPMNLAITGTAILAMFSSLMIGTVLICQGLLALYIENVYYETQDRPLYVVEEEA